MRTHKTIALNPLMFARIAAESGVPVNPVEVQSACGDVPMSRISREDIVRELLRAIMSDAPALFFQGLQSLGMDLFPEITRLREVPQPRSHSGLNGFHHTMHVIVNTPREIYLRWAALCHDLGKGLTPADKWPHFIGHERLGAIEAEKLARRLKIPRDIADAGVLAANAHMLAHSATTLRPGTLVRLVRRLENEFPGGVSHFCQFLLADGGSRKTVEYLCRAVKVMDTGYDVACQQVATLRAAAA